MIIKRIGDNNHDRWKDFKIISSFYEDGLVLNTHRGCLLAAKLPDSIGNCEIAVGHDEVSFDDEKFRGFLYDYLEASELPEPFAYFASHMVREEFETPGGGKSPRRLREYCHKMFETWPALRTGFRADMELTLHKDPAQNNQYLIELLACEKDEEEPDDPWAGATIIYLGWERLDGYRRDILITDKGHLEAYWDEKMGLCTLCVPVVPVRDYTLQNI